MAKTSMNFSIKLALRAAAFKKGLNAVKKEFASFMNSFLGMASAMGAGIGLEKLFSSIYDSTVKLSTANAVLRNVSTSQDELATSQAFLNRLSTTYKQNIVGLTNEFAQFKAAADACGVTLEDQYKIYEALTRAAAYYHLSSEQVANMQMAITQMMSKGKVTAEELRRQLGNVLPGAFGLMAQAMGITTAEMEDMMRKGDLLSAEALPRFAERLNEVTKDIDLNSLQLSINETANAWSRLVQAMDLEGTFSGAFSLASWVFGYVERHIKTIGDLFYSYLIGGAAKWVTMIGISTKVAWEGIIKKIKEAITLTEALKAITGNWAAILVQITTTLAAWGAFSIFRDNDDDEKIKSVKKTLQEVNNENNAIINQADKLLGNLKSANDKLEDRKAILSQLNTLLGLNGEEALSEKSTYEEINGLVKKRLALLANQNKINALTENTLERQRQIEENKQKIEDNRLMMQYYQSKIGNASNKSVGFSGQKGYEKQIKDLEESNKKLASENDAHQKAIDKNTAAITNLTKDVNAASSQDAIDKAKNNYNTDLQKLQYQKSKGALNDKQFSQKWLALINQTMQKLGEIEGGLDGNFAQSLSERKAELDKLLKKDFIEPKDKKPKTPSEKLDEEIEKYKQSIAELNGQLKNEAITQEEFNDKLIDAGDNAYLAMTKIEGFAELLKALSGDAAALVEQAKQANKAVQDKANAEKDAKYNKEAAKVEMPKWSRDTTFDYKKTKSDIYGEVADAWDDYVDGITSAKEALESLKEEFGSLKAEEQKTLDSLSKDLDIATAYANSFKEAADLAQVNEDIKEYQKNLSEAQYDFLKDSVSDLESVANAVKKVSEAYRDEDSTYWERLFANLDMIFSLIDGFNAAMETYNAIQEISTALTAAKASAEQKEAYAATAAAIAEKARAEATQDAAVSDIIGSKAADMKASSTAKQAVSEGAESVAKIPYIGAALAVAAAGSIVAALVAGFSKFEKGGIVGGSSTHGDKNFIRANSGEMVLTKGQQTTLFNMLNGKGVGGNAVDFRIKGTDLIGVLNNTNSKRKSFN